jgi:hypothetical protein
METIQNINFKKLLLINIFIGNNDKYRQRNYCWQITLQAELVTSTATVCYSRSAQYVTIILRSTITILLYRLDRHNDIVNSSDYVHSVEREDGQRIMNCKGCGTNWLWPKLRFILEFAWESEETHENPQ